MTGFWFLFKMLTNYAQFLKRGVYRESIVIDFCKEQLMANATKHSRKI